MQRRREMGRRMKLLAKKSSTKLKKKRTSKERYCISSKINKTSKDDGHQKTIR